MNYEDIFNEIGQFGKWQRNVFAVACLCSMGCSFLTLSFSSFIGFTPEFRCFIPQCEGEDANYNSNFTAFAIPDWGCSDDSDCIQNSHCKMYAYIDKTDDICSAEFFDNHTLQICDTHVYDRSEYRNSFIAELDLAPSCKSQNDSWPLEVSKMMSFDKSYNHNFNTYAYNVAQIIQSFVSFSSQQWTNPPSSRCAICLA